MERKKTDNITRSSVPSGGRCGRADLFLIGALLTIGAALLLYIRISAKAGDVLQVRIDGQTVAEYPMDEELDVILTGKDAGTNRLIISDGQAWFSEASCPDHLCMGMGRIEKTGQSIICLPNHVSVEITNRGDNAGYSETQSTDGSGKSDTGKGAVDAVVGR